MTRPLIALSPGLALLTSCTSKGSDMAMTDEVPDHYRADGWEVYPCGSEDTAFRRDGMTVGATVRADGTARVSGSSGCQR